MDVMDRAQAPGPPICSSRRLIEASKAVRDPPNKSGIKEKIMRRIVLLVLVAVLLTVAAAYAHHSYGATYEVSKEIRLQGKLVQFVFRNPHAFVHVQAPDSNG